MWLFIHLKNGQKVGFDSLFENNIITVRICFGLHKATIKKEPLIFHA